MKTTTYGQRGGDGPTAGKRRTVYEIVTADGTRLTKASFTRDVPELWAIVVFHKGRYLATLWDDAAIGAGTVPRDVMFQTIRAKRLQK